VYVSLQGKVENRHCYQFMVLLLPVGKKIFPNDAYASGIASNPGSGDANDMR
jgi:hypothetical protein